MEIDNFIQAIVRLKTEYKSFFEWQHFIENGGEPPEEFLDFTLLNWANLAHVN